MQLCFCADVRSIHTLRWIEAFASNNEIDLISFDYDGVATGAVTPESFHALGVRTHLVPRSPPGILATPLIVRHLIRGIGPDLVHAHYLTQYGFCAAVAGVHPLVMSCWGNDILIDPHKNRLYRAMVQYALNQADLITVDGSNYRHHLENDFGIRDRVVQVAHGVDTAVFSPTRRNPTAVVGGGPMVISIRGFDPIYDPVTLVRAIPAVLAAHPDAIFVIGGAAGAACNATLQEADRLGVTGAIRFPGYITHADLPTLLASADIYVSTATSDGGIPVSTLEAMASGCAMVITSAGDHKDLISAGAGEVVSVGDHERIAARIIMLLDKPEVRAAMGANARKVAVDRYDSANEMARMRALYEGLVARRRA